MRRVYGGTLAPCASVDVLATFATAAAPRAAPPCVSNIIALASGSRACGRPARVTARRGVVGDEFWSRVVWLGEKRVRSPSK